MVFFVNILSLVIDAEVRYAVRNEYAQTAIDVIARRTRLAFLNAQAAFDVLPLVVDIMGEELEWSYSQRQKEIADAVKFLGSMGLPPALMTPSSRPEAIPKTRIEEFERFLLRAGRGLLNIVGWRDVMQTVNQTDAFTSSRSKFEAGEVAALKQAFSARTSLVDGVKKVPVGGILDILKEIPGYADLTKKELDYVLDEAGMKDGEVAFDEFIEVRPTFKNGQTY